MRTNQAPLFVILAATGLALGAGCGDPLTSPTVVEDLRVLAIRAEPPELLVGPDGVIDPRSVTFEALVVDPRGLTMNYAWSFCPVDSDETCGNYDAKAAVAPPATIAALEAARAERRDGQAMRTETDGIGGMTVDAFPVDVPDELFTYHLVDSALGLGNGAWLSGVLALTTDSEQLLAQKRIVLGARDLSAWNDVLEERFGLQVCPASENPAPAGCLPLRPRTPNHNPEIATLEIARGTRADTPFEAATDPIVVAPGETIRVRPVLAPGASEIYQEVTSALQGNSLFVEEKTEEPIVSWFATAGTFRDPHTVAQVTKTLDNVYTAPDAPPAADGRVSMWIVVRDQRGGTGWRRVDIKIGAGGAPL